MLLTWVYVRSIAVYFNFNEDKLAPDAAKMLNKKILAYGKLVL